MKQAVRQTDRQTETGILKRADRQKDRQTDRQADKTDRQTGILKQHNVAQQTDFVDLQFVASCTKCLNETMITLFGRLSVFRSVRK